MSPYEVPRRDRMYARPRGAWFDFKSWRAALERHRPLIQRYMPPRWTLIAGFYLLLLAWIAPVLASTFNAKALRDMGAALQEIGAHKIFWAAAFIAATYAVMCVMEVLALRDAHVPWLGARSMIVPLLANSVSMGTGFGMVSGAGLRVRLYERWNVDPAHSVFVASSVTVMSVAGGASLAAIGLILSPDLIGSSLWVSPRVLEFIGAMIVALFIVGLGLAGHEPRVFTIAGRSFRAPRAQGWAGRIGAGLADWLFSAAALYMLLPAHLPIGFLSFAALFAAIHLGAMATGLPGGIGVFDAVMLRLCPPSVPIGAMAAALIAYRLVGFLAPSILGALSLGAYEAGGFGAKAIKARREETVAHVAHWAAQTWASWIAPPRAKSAARVTTNVGNLFTSARNTRPISLARLAGKGPILVIAPHPDDETLGCGGLLAACAAQGIKAHVVILTDGGKSHRGSATWNISRVAARREGEAHRAITRLGLKRADLSLLECADGDLLFSPNLRRRAFAALARVAAKTGARTIFVTWPHDPHPDHIAAAMLADQLKRRMPRLRLIHYPIWGRFLPRSLEIRDRAWRGVLLDVRGFQHTKKRALSAYRSQTTRLIHDAAVSHQLTREHTRAFLGPHEIYLL